MTDANRHSSEATQLCHRCTATPAPHLATWQGGWLVIEPGVRLAFCGPCWREALAGPGEEAARAVGKQ